MYFPQYKHFCYLQELTEEQRQKIRSYREDCTEETKVDPTLIDRADRGDFADDPALKCFAKCFYQRAGFMNDRAELQLDVIRSKIPRGANRERAMAVIEGCKDVKGDDACDTAFAVHKCYFERSAGIKRSSPGAGKVKKA